MWSSASSPAPVRGGEENLENGASVASMSPPGRVHWASSDPVALPCGGRGHSLSWVRTGKETWTSVSRVRPAPGLRRGGEDSAQSQGPPGPPPPGTRRIKAWVGSADTS